jgi:ADP-ribose pyrophosphatase YjhB (NUDIX family)
MITTNLLDEIKKLKAITDVGLLYCSNQYDRERYAEIQEISFRLLAKVTSHRVEDLKESFPLSKDYPTAKVDIRGFVLSPNKKILLVKESADSKWSLPGGWADIGYTPKEIVIKEVKEETGLDVSVERLLAVFDKRKHNHPAQASYVYKMIFYCAAVSSEITKAFDVLDVGYFSINDLPPLSEERILKSQIELVYKKIETEDIATYFE